MPRAIAGGILAVFAFACTSVLHADSEWPIDQRDRMESHAALLDSHTRRLYYEVRSHAEGDDEQSQLLSDARELWRVARRFNDLTLDRVESSRLEREARRLEEAFHAVEERFQELREARVAVPPVRKRLQRIDGLVHDAHDDVHVLLDRESASQVSGNAPQRPAPGYYVDPRSRVQEAGRRAADYVDPPAVRVGPDGFYFDGRRFPIPLGR